MPTKEATGGSRTSPRLYPSPSPTGRGGGVTAQTVTERVRSKNYAIFVRGVTAQAVTEGVGEAVTFDYLHSLS